VGPGLIPDVVRAECHSNDWAWQVPFFDAAPWFAQATDGEILAVAGLAVDLAAGVLGDRVVADQGDGARGHEVAQEEAGEQGGQGQAGPLGLRQHAVVAGGGANLYEPPPPYAGKGRRPKKGAKAPAPRAVVAGTAARSRLNVAWYGGGRRDVEVVSGLGHWYKGGVGLVAVRWVYVHDLSGTHRDEYFYSTAVGLTARDINERYTQRWNIETTFEEMRAYLGLETTRGRCPKTVLRAEPMLLGLDSVVALLYAQLPAEVQEAGGVDWDGKVTVTFSNAISAVRRWLWANWVFVKGGHAHAFSKLPEPLRQALLYALAPAA
jgi:hypothetical protein